MTSILLKLVYQMLISLIKPYSVSIFVLFKFIDVKKNHSQWLTFYKIHCFAVARRKTIYEYHKVQFESVNIQNNTIVRLTALPTCVSFTDCVSCVTSDLKEQKVSYNYIDMSSITVFVITNFFRSFFNSMKCYAVFVVSRNECMFNWTRS